MCKLTIVVCAVAVFLAASLNAMAQQTETDHEAQAHGKPITQSHPVQPRPDVVEERLKHHEQLLQSKPSHYTGTSPKGAPDQSQRSK